jgi:hypothetical protein
VEDGSREYLIEAEPTAAAFPWPPAEGESVVNAYGRTWRGAALEPRAFFGALPAQQSLGPALLYYLPLGIAVAGAQLFWSSIRGTVDTERDAVLGAELPALSPLVEFLLSPVMLILTIFVAAGLVHLLLRLLGGASRDFGFTVRVFAYAYSPQILGVVPVVGSAVGFFWMVGVAIIGLREGHRTSTGKAATAVLVPLAVALTFFAIVTLIAATGSLLME